MTKESEFGPSARTPPSTVSSSYILRYSFSYSIPASPSLPGINQYPEQSEGVDTDHRNSRSRLNESCIPSIISRVRYSS